MKKANNEALAFKEPNKEDLLALRKAVESGNVTEVRRRIWENPRYLIGTAETPMVLQEGCRYNALHICALRNRAEVCSLILETIADVSFIRLLYPDVDNFYLRKRSEFLTDRYLNTPDKGANESPLHFACKFGHVEMVALLSRHPKVDRSLCNKYNERATDMVCARVSKSPAGLKEKITLILDGEYFVRLLRSEDNDAKIAPPWSPSQGLPDDDIQTVGHADTRERREFLESRKDARFSESPMKEPMSVKAWAGPMSRAQAELFRLRWTASPRAAGLERENIIKYKQMLRTDVAKGLERIGRKLCSSMDVPWTEYWPFLDAFADIRSVDGLRRLEEHLVKQSEAVDAEVKMKEEEERQLLIPVVGIRDDSVRLECHVEGHERNHLVLNNDSRVNDSLENRQSGNDWHLVIENERVECDDSKNIRVHKTELCSSVNENMGTNLSVVITNTDFPVNDSKNNSSKGNTGLPGENNSVIHCSPEENLPVIGENLPVIGLTGNNLSVIGLPENNLPISGVCENSVPLTSLPENISMTTGILVPEMMLETVNLSKGNSTTLDLPEINLPTIELSETNLQTTDCPEINLQTTYLSESNSQTSDLAEANLQTTDLVKNDLPTAGLPEKSLSKNYLPENNLSVANLPENNSLLASSSVNSVQLAGVTENCLPTTLQPENNLPTTGLSENNLQITTLPENHLPTTGSRKIRSSNSSFPLNYFISKLFSLFTSNDCTSPNKDSLPINEPPKEPDLSINDTSRSATTEMSCIELQSGPSANSSCLLFADDAENNVTLNNEQECGVDKGGGVSDCLNDEEIMSDRLSGGIVDEVNMSGIVSEQCAAGGSDEGEHSRGVDVIGADKYKNANKEDMDAEDNDSYKTADSDLDMDYAETTSDMNAYWPDWPTNIVFINGSQPSRYDLDVYRALDDLEISMSSNPRVYTWRNLVESFPEDVRCRWSARQRRGVKRKIFCSSNDFDEVGNGSSGMMKSDMDCKRMCLLNE